MIDATRTYRCPGQRGTIRRALHLARVAAFYPVCRYCQHRGDLALLPSHLVRQLERSWQRGPTAARFEEEGFVGAYGNELGPPEARRAAAALGVLLSEDRGHDAGPIKVVLAHDGRSMTAGLVAAAAEGLRWSGCHVVDVGAATAACALWVAGETAAAGAVRIGNPLGESHTAGLRFWKAAGEPLVSGAEWDRLIKLERDGVDRPTRRFAAMERVRAENAYLESLATSYHALRPLRVVVETSCAPLISYLERLFGRVACELVCARRGGVAELVRAKGAHLGVHADDDGARCAIFDERGEAVAAERLFLLAARSRLEEYGEGTVVAPAEWTAGLGPRVTALGGRLIAAEPSAAAIAEAMRSHGAVLGASGDGALWHRIAAGIAAPDGLRTITLVLEQLSRSDRPLSAVLDAEAAAE